jgi:hypothetical protein
MIIELCPEIFMMRFNDVKKSDNFNHCWIQTSLGGQL